MTDTSCHGDDLPEYRVRARNLATDSENAIHDDQVARAYGFKGGLVPGVIVHAYMTYPVVRLFGLDWLERGAMTTRFLRPVYDGESIRVWATTAQRGDTGKQLVELETYNESGELCSKARAWVDDGENPPSISAYPAAELPAERLPADPTALSAVQAFGSLEYVFDFAKAVDFLQSIGDDLAIYPSERIAHPGFLLAGANHLLARNVALGPWIHVGSEIVSFAAVHDGDSVSVRGKPVRVWERKGNHFVELDVLFVVGGVTPVLRVTHTAIYALARR
jgi:acyl dehydratase